MSELIINAENMNRFLVDKGIFFPNEVEVYIVGVTIKNGGMKNSTDFVCGYC